MTGDRKRAEASAPRSSRQGDRNRLICTILLDTKRPCCAAQFCLAITLAKAGMSGGEAVPELEILSFAASQGP
jgi:hypothetical protein